MTRATSALVAACVGVLAGCATLQVDRNLDEAARLAGEAAGATPRLLRDDEDRQRARSEIDRLLAQPLDAEGAVRIAVVHGASLQASLFDSAARSAAATHSARLPNPIFTFERLLRREEGGVDKDIERTLAFSVLDLLLLPARLEAADLQQRQLRLKIAGDIVQAAAEARQAWTRAVAARQLAAYALQARDATDAGAELARRMQGVGNYSRLQRAREQALHADAVAQLARAQQAAVAAREALVRTLGLDAEQSARLVIAERLPDLPKDVIAEQALARAALDDRLDVRMARADLEYLAKQQGLTRVTGYVNALELGVRRNSETGKPPQKGFEVEMAVPLFDFGDARRAQAEATYLAAVNRAALVGSHASSQVREAYQGYRAAYDIARHYRDEVVPLRKAIADEMLLRYNGMLTGVFELLAETRAQAAVVMQAIEAQRDFWLADAALRASLVGRPPGGSAMEISRTTPSPGAGGH